MAEDKVPFFQPEGAAFKSRQYQHVGSINKPVYLHLLQSTPLNNWEHPERCLSPQPMHSAEKMTPKPENRLSRYIQDPYYLLDHQSQGPISAAVCITTTQPLTSTMPWQMKVVISLQPTESASTALFDRRTHQDMLTCWRCLQQELERGKTGCQIQSQNCADKGTRELIYHINVLIVQYSSKELA